MRLWKWNLDDNEIEFEDKEAVNQTDGELNDTIVTYEGNTSDVNSWTDFIASFVNGMKIGKFFKNLYAGIQYVLHVGSLVNNCVSDNSDLPLAAAQGKVLMDELTELKSDLSELIIIQSYALGSIDITTSRSGLYVSGTLSITIEPPSGYSCIGIVGINTSNMDVWTGRAYMSSSTTIGVLFCSLLSLTATPTAYLLFKKNS